MPRSRQKNKIKNSIDKQKIGIFLIENFNQSCAKISPPLLTIQSTKRSLTIMTGNVFSIKAEVMNIIE